MEPDKRERFDELLAEQVAGELDETSRLELLAIVDSDAEAHDAYERWLREDEELTLLFAADAERFAGPPPAAPPELAAAMAGRRARRGVLVPFAWAAAALIMIVGGFQGWRLYQRQVPRGDALLASVLAVEGRATLLTGAEPVALVPLAELRQDSQIRVGHGGYLALRLTDGNILEARAGSRPALRRFADRTEVRLEQGQIWAHLQAPLDRPFAIATRGMRAVATGTVYGVSAGLSGDIAAVAEGAITVEAEGRTLGLDAGDTFNSRTGQAAPLPDAALDWSRYPENLVALRTSGPVEQAVAALQLEAAAPPAPAAAGDEATTGTAPVRTVDDLANLLPDTTRAFFAVQDWPAITAGFSGSAYSMLLRQDSIRKWWDTVGGRQVAGEVLDEAQVREIIALARLVDGQLVVGVEAGKQFILIADCHASPDEFRRRLVDVVTGLNQGRTLSPGQLEAFFDRVVLRAGRLVVSSSPELLRATLERLDRGQPTGFTDSGFFRKIETAAGGAPFVFAVDLAAIFGSVPPTDLALQRRLNLAGLSGLDYLVIAPQFRGGGINQAARLGFQRTRFGALNWLAEPAPMHSLQFFSPETHILAAAVTVSPRMMFFDWLQYLMGEDVAALERWRLFFDRHEALFDSVGREIAVGIENPILPIPNVRLVAELADPVAFQAHLDALLRALTLEFEAKGRFAYVETTDGGGYSIDSFYVDGWLLQPSWAVIDDHLVVGPGPQFVRSAIDLYRTGGSMARSARLARLLPARGAPSVSFLLYQDLVKAIPQFLESKVLSRLGPDERGIFPNLSFLERYSAPGVMYAIAAPRHIDLYLNTPDGLDLNLGMTVPLVAEWIKPHPNVGEQINAYADAVVTLESLGRRLMVDSDNVSWGSATDLGALLGEREAIPLDPWNRPLRIAPGPEAGKIVLYSLGPDGVDQGGKTLYDPVGPADGPGDIIMVLPPAEGGEPHVPRPGE